MGVKGIAPAVAQAWAERTCEAQGVPVKATDARLVERLVPLLGQARQTGSTRSGSKVPRPRTAGRTTARSISAATTDR